MLLTKQFFHTACKTICISLKTVRGVQLSIVGSLFTLTQLSVPSHKNIGANQSVFGSYLWVPFFTKSVCRFLFCYVLVCKGLPQV